MGTNRLRRWILLGLATLALPLMGATSEGPSGCSCGTASTTVEADEGVAESENYTLKRAENGYGFEVMTSSGGSYKVNATIGHYLSIPEIRSDRYEIRHPMSRNVIPQSE